MGQRLETDETPNLIASDKVEGTVVYDPEGERLGTVRNFMVDKRSGKADYAVLEFGGLFGLGSDHYPIPWEMLTYDTLKGGYVVSISKDELSDAPRYRDTDMPEYTNDYGRTVYGHYGLIYPHL